MGFVFILGFVAILVGAVTLFRFQQRVREIRLFASLHGLTVLGSEWDLGDCGFSLFHAGNRRYWRNVMRGMWGTLPVTYCDYSYVVSDGRNQSTISFSNVIAMLDMEIPWVTVSPRSALGAIAEKTIGAPGLRFESIEFNDRFDVQSSDRSFAVELIDAEMIETLLALDRGCHVVFGPQYLMVYRHRTPVTEIRGIFESTVTVEQRIPALVRARFPQPPPGSDAPSQPST